MALSSLYHALLAQLAINDLICGKPPHLILTLHDDGGIYRFHHDGGDFDVPLHHDDDGGASFEEFHDDGERDGDVSAQFGEFREEYFQIALLAVVSPLR